MGKQSTRKNKTIYQICREAQGLTREKAAELMPILRQSDGQDSVVIYVENPKAMKRLPPSDSVSADDGLIEQLVSIFGKENVKLVEKGIENTGRML